MPQLPRTTVDFCVSEEWSDLPEVNIALFLLMQRCLALSKIMGKFFSPWSVLKPISNFLPN